MPTVAHRRVMKFHSAGTCCNIVAARSRYAPSSFNFPYAASKNYWLVSLYLSFISFIASWYLVKQIVRIHASLTLPAVVAFLFLPTAVFWSSGLIKESIAMAALYFLAAIVVKLWLNDRVKVYTWIVVPLALWILCNLKYYYLAVFLNLRRTGTYLLGFGNSTGRSIRVLFRLLLLE